MRICVFIAAALLCALSLGSPAAQRELQPMSARAAPELGLTDLQGAKHDLASYRGKVVLVNFWATWCEPCRLEMPSIERLRSRFAGQPFAALAVNLDEPEARVRRFLQQTPMDLPILLDPNKAASRRWDVRVLPATYIVAPDGRVRYRAIGELDWNDEKVAGVVSRLIRGE